MIEKLDTPTGIVVNWTVLIGMLIAGVAWAVDKGEDVATVQAQLPMIQQAQQVEADHQRERFDVLKERAQRIEKGQDEIRTMLRQLITK